MQNLAPYFWSKLPDRNAIVDLIHNVGGSIVARAEARLLHEDLTPFVIPGNPNGLDPADISSWLMAGTVENNISRSVHRQLSMTVDEITAATLNALTDRVEIRLCYYLSGSFTQPVLSVPIGVFLLDFPDLTIAQTHNTLDITGYDRTQIIADIEDFEAPYTAPAGANYVDLAKVLVQMDKNPPPPFGTGRAPTGGGWPWSSNPAQAPNGCVCVGPDWPTDQIDAQSTTLFTPFPIIIDQATDLLDAVDNSVLAPANYWPAWANSQARLQMQPIPYQYPGYRPTAADAEWEYSTISKSILNGKVGVKLADKQNLANRVQIVSYNTSLPRPIFITMQNDSFDSAISVPLLGRVKFKSIRDDNIPDLATATARCVIELNARAIANESVEFTTAWNPFHETHDLLALNVYTKAGKVLELSSAVSPFLETQWTIDLRSPTTMQHLAGRYIAV